MNDIDRDDWIDNDPPDASGRVVHLMRRVAFAYADRAARAATDIGLHPTDLRALALILDAGRAHVVLTVGALGAELRMNQPTVTAIVDRLTEHGYVQRTPVPGDRRKVGLTVTDQGRASGWAAFGSLVESLHERISMTSAADIAAAETVLRLALNALETDI